MNVRASQWPWGASGASAYSGKKQQQDNVSNKMLPQPLLLQVESRDQHQHHLGVYENYSISGPTPDCISKQPGDWGAH